MTKEANRIYADIACLNTTESPATLISTTGSHCEVWEYARIHVIGEKKDFTNYVIKTPTVAYSVPEIDILNRDYKRLRAALGSIIPETTFIKTLVNKELNVLVLSDVVRIWFNIANPINEEEAIHLLKRMPRLRLQLQKFVHYAQHWLKEEGKIIDLYGLDNLVVDVDYNLKFIDSFDVFFHTDLLYLFDTVDEELEEKITLSEKRLEYLEYLLLNAYVEEETVKSIN